MTDDVKRRDAVYRKGLAAALAIIRSADTLRNAAQSIEEAMKPEPSPTGEPILGKSYEHSLTEGSGYPITGVGHHAEDD